MWVFGEIWGWLHTVFFSSCTPYPLFALKTTTLIQFERGKHSTAKKIKITVHFSLPKKWDAGKEITQCSGL